MDREEAEAIRMAKLLEEEKAQFSVRTYSSKSLHGHQAQLSLSY